MTISELKEWQEELARDNPCPHLKKIPGPPLWQMLLDEGSTGVVFTFADGWADKYKERQDE